MSIKDRKKDHVELCLNEDVSYRQGTGLERYQFVHNALPEVDIDEVSLESTFLGRSFSYPLFISSMTGGYSGSGNINGMIAEFCEENNLPFGVGSQRALFDHPEEKKTFSIVREKAPNAFIAANIGGAQLVGELDESNLELLVDSIKADAIIVHLNPLQELVQPEGDRKFSGIESGIRKLVVDSNLPVIVKETGGGISGEVARRLLAAGVEVIDVSGAGGTSWAKVENLRKNEPFILQEFDDWGIPTSTCIEEVNELRNEFRFEMIASGGIQNAFDIVKSIALGADFAAMARPVIQALGDGGKDSLQKKFDQWQHHTRIILTLIGCKTLEQCSKIHLSKK
ncbi:MAG: type 2 isopentenyl-diphosphate Delta-isomerase [Balneolaceae bacterium]